jgi:hypothetical protein
MLLPLGDGRRRQRAFANGAVPSGESPQVRINNNNIDKKYAYAGQTE